jgi:hypothetical protein
MQQVVRVEALGADLLLALEAEQDVVEAVERALVGGGLGRDRGLGWRFCLLLLCLLCLTLIFRYGAELQLDLAEVEGLLPLRRHGAGEVSRLGGRLLEERRLLAVRDGGRLQ